jgi:hypothetical protein
MAAGAMLARPDPEAARSEPELFPETGAVAPAEPVRDAPGVTTTAPEEAPTQALEPVGQPIEWPDPSLAAPPDTGEVAPPPAPSAAPTGTATEDTGEGGAATVEEIPVERGPECGPATCAAGQVCCNASCGLCAAPGERCAQYTCGQPPIPSSAYCGPNTCNVGEVCCNASCGTCVSPGESCDPAPCGRELMDSVSQMCGMVTCNVGLVCCNPSCGTCVAPGTPCSQEPCG